MRSTDDEKRDQVDAVTRSGTARRRRAPALARLQDVARARGNVFEELLETVKVASLGEISGASTTSAASTAATCRAVDRGAHRPPRAARGRAAQGPLEQSGPRANSASAIDERV